MEGDAPTATDAIGRRDYLRASATVVGGSTLLSGCLGELGGIRAAGADSSTDWPTFAGDVGNTGATAAAGPSAATERWSLETGPILTTPAVVDGVVYVGVRRSGDDNTGDDGGRLSAFDADTGERQWSFDVAEWLSGSPAVVDGVVYAAGPTVDASEDGVEQEDTDHRVYAIDTDGTELWTADVDGPGSVSPTVVDGTVYVATWHGTHALEAETGDQRWHHGHDHATHTWGGLAVVDGTVFVGTSTEAYALEATTGDLQWRYSPDDEPSRTWVAPAVVDGTAYLVSGRGELVALDAETGDVQWRADASMPTQTPVVADGTLYAGLLSDSAQEGGRIVAFDTETGEERWTFRTDEPGATVAVGGDTAYVRTLEGVYALDVDDGEPRLDREFESTFGRPWQGAVTEEVTSMPAIADGALFVGSPSGGLYAIGEE
ncbi:PQQ-binding-like beta-propeller repeat protein [Halobacteria archaeon AArc-m2/3/4]|uniref:PQQ-binding-like beta-propeller repeat protein n=1 Tax=Natronoglomus mannanivorans TaxID=2979990 RepID=A0AAP2YW84_9EURY|nr:PQQ-binding-like beta-propeller repeat protein [Halobacteria archaeon AArc-xg1-1]MCU4971820.1 PQQ-binding-like beta-propeller repeat protein [Halobacteria archaeon AArc-m2/3/4]